MYWRPYPTQWRSLYWDYDLAGETLPLEMMTPDEAWDYGAITKSLVLADAPLILRVRAVASQGRIGICISRTNGSALLSMERVLTPADDERTIYFRLEPDQTNASLLVRNYDDDGTHGLVLVQDVAYLPQAEVDKAVLDQVAGPFLE